MAGLLLELRALLIDVAPGPLDHPESVIAALQRAWPELEGNDMHGMYASKIDARRLEQLCWEPPCLIFSIERHGWTVNGSTRAEVQGWVVDIEKGTAQGQATGRRQLEQTAPRLDVLPLASAIAQRIAESADAPELKWSPDRTRVQVQSSKVAGLKTGSAFRQTLGGRRKRFKKALDELLQQAGWHVEPRGWYRKVIPP